MNSNKIIYDVFIIAGGLAGLNSAKNLVKDSDLKIGLVERTRSKEIILPGLPLKKSTLNHITSIIVLSVPYNSFGIINHHGSKSIHSYINNEFVAIKLQ